MRKIMGIVLSVYIALVCTRVAGGQNLFTFTNPTGGITVNGYLEERFGLTESGVNVVFTTTGPGVRILEIVPANIPNFTGERVLGYLRFSATAGAPRATECGFEHSVGAWSSRTKAHRLRLGRVGVTKLRSRRGYASPGVRGCTRHIAARAAC